MQWIVQDLGGEIGKGHQREYGVENVVRASGALFGSRSEFRALMSHGDHADKLPSELEPTAYSQKNVIAGFSHKTKPIFGLQFHPEVHHTDHGLEILKSFLKLSGFSFSWKPAHIFDEMAEKIRAQVGSGRILCALSGGVDSAVVAVVLNRLFPDQVDCLCVDTGLLRKGEIEQLDNLFKQKFKFKTHIVDASEEFLNALKGVIDPEDKRKKIGHLFIETFEKEAMKFSNYQIFSSGNSLSRCDRKYRLFMGGLLPKSKSHKVGGLPERSICLVNRSNCLGQFETRELGSP